MVDFNRGLGIYGVIGASIASITMCILSLLLHPVDISHIEYGICLPSPDTWDFNPVWSWIFNTLLIGLIAILLYLLNKTYNFIRTT